MEQAKGTQQQLDLWKDSSSSSTPHPGRGAALTRHLIGSEEEVVEKNDDDDDGDFGLVDPPAARFCSGGREQQRVWAHLQKTPEM